jgi:hypothetical protein
MTQGMDILNAQAGAAASEPRVLLKTIRAIDGRRGLGATLGATRMNNLRTSRTDLDSWGRRARGHGLG